MTALEAFEYIKEELRSGYAEELAYRESDDFVPEDETPGLSLVADGSYSENSGCYAFAVFYTINGKPESDKGFSYCVDKKTGAVTSSDAPGIFLSSFKKKLRLQEGVFDPEREKVA